MTLGPNLLGLDRMFLHVLPLGVLVAFEHLWIASALVDSKCWTSARGLALLTRQAPVVRPFICVVIETASYAPSSRLSGLPVLLHVCTIFALHLCLLSCCSPALAPPAQSNNKVLRSTLKPMYVKFEMWT